MMETKLVAIARFYDIKAGKVREIDEEFYTNPDRANLLEFRNLARRVPVEHKARKPRKTLD